MRCGAGKKNKTCNKSFVTYTARGREKISNLSKVDFELKSVRMRALTSRRKAGLSISTAVVGGYIAWCLLLLLLLSYMYIYNKHTKLYKLWGFNEFSKDDLYTCMVTESSKFFGTLKLLSICTAWSSDLLIILLKE